MPVGYFPSLDADDEHAETVEVAFLRPNGGEVVLRLLVDSGFTGESSFVLPETADDLAHAAAMSSHAAGALQGLQKRVVVSCRVAVLSVHFAAIAILADTSPLVLPTGVQGVAGLRFLRCFRCWGAEQEDSGMWRFFLATELR